MKELFFDLETTGTNPGKHGIHQISGLIRIDGKELEKFDFVWLNGSVYVNYHGKNSLVYVYKVINRLSTLYWFKKSVRDVTVFKIENLSNFTNIVK